MRLFRLPRTINQTFSGASLYQFADDILSVRRIQNCAKRGLQSLSPRWIWIGEVEHGAAQAGEDGKPDRKGMLDSMHEPNSNPNATSGNIPGVDTIVITSSERLVGGDSSTIGGRPESSSQNAQSDHAPSVRRTIVFDPDPNGVHDPFNPKIRDFPGRCWRLPRCTIDCEFGRLRCS
jgi:hypothetical protein